MTPSCIAGLGLGLLAVIAYQLWEIKVLLRKNGSDSETASLEGLIKKLEKMKAQVQGFIE